MVHFNFKTHGIYNDDHQCMLKVNKPAYTKMAIFSKRKLLLLWILSSCMLCLSKGRRTRDFRIKAVNLGGWLVTEGWIKPSLFDGIPNNDFLVCEMCNHPSLHCSFYELCFSFFLVAVSLGWKLTSVQISNKWEIS